LTWWIEKATIPAMGNVQSVLEICAGLPERCFATAEVVLEEDKKTGLLYILAEGRVEILKRDTRVGTISHPGAIFGDIAILLNQSHSATVRCLAPSRFYVIEDPAGFLVAHPALSLALARGLAERLDSLTRYLVDVKAQYEDRADHLGMVDEVLESLLHHQRKLPPR
jgi:CRP/FNR family transcriptional regulator, cyclic AMP receptor protein